MLLNYVKLLLFRYYFIVFFLGCVTVVNMRIILTLFLYFAKKFTVTTCGKIFIFCYFYRCCCCSRRSKVINSNNSYRSSSRSHWPSRYVTVTDRVTQTTHRLYKMAAKYGPDRRPTQELLTSLSTNGHRTS